MSVYKKKFTCLFSVFVSRIGFILIHLGSIPVENIYRIVFYNILETAVTILSYALLGFVVSFGKTSLAGWIGVGFSLDLVYDWEAAIVGKIKIYILRLLVKTDNCSEAIDFRMIYKL